MDKVSSGLDPAYAEVENISWCYFGLWLAHKGLDFFLVV